ncbi:hypothetical protein E1B28_000575 [Marasmius oreades]|uniref:Uncharacterized protein n=1 Tax=Marasmius oreades TaxID=181124 RepID=A0A9P7V1Q5_9AGAR|nr:uncharacterized protein E1B28_000575 [Marasmius oreades]KAG7098659.1 hypothetical protein E1B28_000575 [Marasmius oreades]
MPHASSDSEPERVAFGRKRADSSSSRESSPGRGRRKRSFSPTSDDGDLVVPPIADDDTPPPENRPLIRQALGFTASGAPSAIQTYEASSVSSSARKTKFLPGQSVEVLPEPKKRPKKKERKGTYGGHTGRFRLTDVPPLSVATSTLAPTTSQFSSCPAQPQPPASFSDPGSSSGFTQHPPSSFATQQPSPTPTHHSVNSPNSYGFSPPPVTANSSCPLPLQSYHSYPVSAAQSMTLVAPSHTPPATFATSSSSLMAFSLPKPTGLPYINPSGNSGSHSNNTSMKTTRKVGSTRSKSSSQTPGVSTMTSSPLPESNAPTVSYYRRNYNDKTLTNSRAASRQSSQTATTGGKDNSARRESQAQSKRSQNQSRIQEPPLPRPKRMVTLLISDMRSGKEDSLLVEVSVPIRPVEHENKDAGFWAQAEDVVQELQASTSRIEGDAKVFTMRGKYRQIFMRSTWDRRSHLSSWEVSPANLSVASDRTLQLIVVAPPKNESAPSPVHIPQDLRPDSLSPEPQLQPEPQLRPQPPPPARSQNQYSEILCSNVEPEPSQSESSRKRCRSMSSSPSSKSPTSIYSRDSKRPKLSTGPDVSDIPQPTVHTHSDEEDIELIDQLDQDLVQNHDSPGSDDDQEEIESRITERVDCLLQNDEEWPRFFGYKAKPKHVPAMLQQYGFVKRMADRYEGRRVPFRSVRGLRIRMIHILKALHLDEDPKFGDDCVETMNLLALYGPAGSRLQDPRVKDEMENTQEPEYNSKPIKKFLRLLRSIDEEWKAKGIETTPPGDSEPMIRRNDSAIRDE